MRKEVVIILVLLVGGVLVAWNWNGASPLSFNSARGVASLAATPEPAAPEPKPAARSTGQKGARSRAADDGPSARGGSSKEVPPVFPPTIMTVEIPADVPFPTPDTMKIGSTRKELRAAFGDPTMDIAGTRNGRVIERYYYLSRDRNRLTMATVENGIIISAESLSNPYFQLPAANK